MKKRFALLASLIIASAAMVAGIGAYLKYEVIRPLNLPDYGDKSIFELPFLVYSDPVLQFMLEHAEQMQRPPKPTDFPVPTTASTPAATGGTTSPQPTDPTHTAGPLPSTDPVPPPTTSSTTAPPPPPTQSPGGPNFNYPGPAVNDAWFDNTLFIGDSRVVGLREFARSGKADYFCDVGMNVFNASSKQLSDKGFSKQTLSSLLSSRKYDKIFIAFGLNESGYPYSSFTWQYENFVKEVRRQQPDAVIILMGVMSVTRKFAATANYFQPSHLAKMSAFIKSLADGKKTFYVDVNEYFADSEGYLYTSLTNDGHHPTGNGYREWRRWIAYICGTLKI